MTAALSKGHAGRARGQWSRWGQEWSSVTNAQYTGSTVLLSLYIAAASLRSQCTSLSVSCTSTVVLNYISSLTRWLAGSQSCDINVCCASLVTGAALLNQLTINWVTGHVGTSNNSRTQSLLLTALRMYMYDRPID